MPKMKTHSGAAKRFKITGSGKIMRLRANRRHLLEHKSSRVTRRLAGASMSHLSVSDRLELGGSQQLAVALDVLHDKPGEFVRRLLDRYDPHLR